MENLVKTQPLKAELRSYVSMVRVRLKFSSLNEGKSVNTSFNVFLLFPFSFHYNFLEFIAIFQRKFPERHWGESNSKKKGGFCLDFWSENPNPRSKSEIDLNHVCPCWGLWDAEKHMKRRTRRRRRDVGRVTNNEPTGWER